VALESLRALSLRKSAAPFLFGFCSKLRETRGSRALAPDCSALYEQRIWKNAAAMSRRIRER
jgi:hypothetical protein